jgi:Uma2 family endonuclease
MATTTQKLITAEEFAKMPEPPDGFKQELVRGRIVTMSPPPGFEHGDVQLNVGTLLKVYVRSKRLGRVVVESRVVTERDPDTVRGPDVSVWSKERMPLNRPRPKGYPKVAANLCVEVVSSKKSLARAKSKLTEYFKRGVHMVWIVDPENRTVTVYRKANEGRILHEAATLSGEDVVPGFTCRVADLFV